MKELLKSLDDILAILEKTKETSRKMIYESGEKDTAMDFLNVCHNINRAERCVYDTMTALINVCVREQRKDAEQCEN